MNELIFSPQFETSNSTHVQLLVVMWKD